MVSRDDFTGEARQRILAGNETTGNKSASALSSISSLETEQNCCKKAKNTLMMGMAMAAAMSGTATNHRSWGDQRRVGGRPRMSGAMPVKKAKRKNKQAQQRKNRKK